MALVLNLVKTLVERAPHHATASGERKAIALMMRIFSFLRRSLIKKDVPNANNLLKAFFLGNDALTRTW